MNFDIDTFNKVIIELVKIGATSFLTFFIIKKSSYRQEKGKNLATQEDIAKITRLIEETKISFTHATETFKSSLLLSNNVQFGIIADQKKALIGFFENLYVQINIVDGMHLNILPQPQEIPSLRKKILERIAECSKVRATLNFFVDDYDIQSLAQDINDILIEDIITPLDMLLIQLIEFYKIPEEKKAGKYLNLIKPSLDKHTEALEKLGPLITSFEETARAFIAKNTTYK